MKFVVSFVLMAFLSFTACLYFPWWSIAIVCFLVSVFIHQKAGMAFLSGFLALFLLWGGLSLWISQNNNHILAHRISQLIIKKDDPYMLILFTGLIGALVGGLAAISGSYTRKVNKA